MCSTGARGVDRAAFLTRQPTTKVPNAQVMKLTHKMGNADRWARGLIVGPAAIVVAVLIGAGSLLGIILIAIGTVMPLTTNVGMCPVHALLAVDTHRHDQAALGS